MRLIQNLNINQNNDTEGKLWPIMEGVESPVKIDSFAWMDIYKT